MIGHISLSKLQGNQAPFYHSSPYLLTEVKIVLQIIAINLQKKRQNPASTTPANRTTTDTFLKNQRTDIYFYR
jgi:hypothetical protein